MHKNNKNQGKKNKNQGKAEYLRLIKCGLLLVLALDLHIFVLLAHDSAMCCPGVAQQNNSCLKHGNPGERVSWEDFGGFLVDFYFSLRSFFLVRFGRGAGLGVVGMEEKSRMRTNRDPRAGWGLQLPQCLILILPVLLIVFLVSSLWNLYSNGFVADKASSLNFNESLQVKTL